MSERQALTTMSSLHTWLFKNIQNTCFQCFETLIILLQAITLVARNHVTGELIIHQFDWFLTGLQASTIKRCVDLVREIISEPRLVFRMIT